MAKRADVLEFAVLGLLHETPMHGYELRKRLNATLGALRAFSYGSLYPCLKGLVARGLITEQAAQAGVERAVRQRPEDTERGVEPLAQLVAVHGALVQQSEDRELEQLTAATHDASLHTRHTDGGRAAPRGRPAGGSVAR